MVSLFLERVWILVTTSVTPARSRTVRTAEPATSPRPFDGMISTVEEAYFEATWCGMEPVLGAKHGNHMALGVAGSLIDSERCVDGLTKADTDATFLVADNDNEREIEAPAAGHNAGHTASVNGHLLKLSPLARRAAATTSTLRTSTNRSAAAASVCWTCCCW